MRKLIYILILFIAYAATCRQDSKFKKLIPAKPTGWVSDFEKNFTDEQVQFLDSMIWKHESETSNEISVVTLALDTVSIPSEKEFDQFSLTLFNQWGIGKKEKNNGVGIIFSNKLRKLRIEVGKGMESKLTNAEAKFIIDSLIIPEFKTSNYFAGTLKGLQAVIKEIQ